MYYLCEKYDKPITVQYYIADCVSWVPRLTSLDLRTDWTYERTLRMELVHMYKGFLESIYKDHERKSTRCSVPLNLEYE